MVNDSAVPFFQGLTAWVTSHLYNLALFFGSVVVIFIIYKLLSGQVERLHEQGKLNINASFLLRRVLYWSSILLSLSLLFGLFGIRLDLVAGLMVLAGGTVVGFAAINTIGNAIAGIIVMVSNPFEIGDRIRFEGDFADIENIDLIYTRMRTLDNVLISLPNQRLLEREIENYGAKGTIRRRCTVTAGYDVDREYVEKALMEVVSRVEGILEEPAPYVRVTELGSFAAEYTLYSYVGDAQDIRRVDADINREVMEVFKQYEIDLSTPNLIHSI
ncbi:MAG: mechanosensitive ion channel [Candidatus Bathyarchaeota archaeon]|jgi:small-conductance mechanosensitive channel